MVVVDDVVAKAFKRAVDAELEKAVRNILKRIELVEIPQPANLERKFELRIPGVSHE